MKTVTTVEIGLYERMAPLVGGYLEAHALSDPHLKGTYRFNKYSGTAGVRPDVLARHLINYKSDVYAFSCYVWNAKYIMRLLAQVREAVQEATFVLGGPQVMHNADAYLQPKMDNVAVCNGEGEITFAAYLSEMTERRPDLSRVPGLSFLSRGEIITTAPRSRLDILDKIPSPFLNDLFKNEFAVTVFETNRGCPFHCGFCYWGGATNDRVYRFSDARIREELTWLSKKGILMIYLADANWGMLSRDLGFTQHIADCKTLFGFPQMVYFSSSKNKPERVTRITEIFRSAAIIASQPISLQSLDERTLRTIDRENIKLSSFVQVQERLDQLQISSYNELIWPLPGETLFSFRQGLGRLCRLGSGSLLVFPHMLLANTPLFRRRHDLKMQTVCSADDASDAEFVVATRDVTREEWAEGFRYYYSVVLLHNLFGLRATSSFVDRRGLVSIEEFFSEFTRFWRGRREYRLVAFIEDAIDSFACFDMHFLGKLIHYSLDEYRSDLDELVNGFIGSRRYYHQDLQCVYEIDRLLRLYVYSSTPFGFGRTPFQVFGAGTRLRTYRVLIPERYRALIIEALRSLRIHTSESWMAIEINHARFQYPHMGAESLEHNAGYCHGMLTRPDSMTPTVCGFGRTDL